MSAWSHTINYRNKINFICNNSKNAHPEKQNSPIQKLFQIRHHLRYRQITSYSDCLMPDSKLLCTYQKMAYEFRRFIKGWLRPMLILLMKSKHLSFQSIKLHSSDPELNKQVCMYQYMQTVWYMESDRGNGMYRLPKIPLDRSN